jgi:hypothetical protein
LRLELVAVACAEEFGRRSDARRETSTATHVAFEPPVPLYSLF